MPRPHHKGKLLILAALCATLTAHAAELVTLRTGFTITCASHESLSTDSVRLHLSNDGYMDVATNAIATIEQTPDVLATPPAPKPTDNYIATSGAKHNVNIALLESVIKAESNGNTHAVSRTGAQGLMQLMPGTAAQLGVTDSFSPEGNVNGGSAYLDQLLTRYHENLALALAAYNAGPGAVDKYHGIPPYRETRQYVARVIREFNKRVLASQHALAAGVPAK